MAAFAKNAAKSVIEGMRGMAAVAGNAANGVMKGMSGNTTVKTALREMTIIRIFARFSPWRYINVGVADWKNQK
jgi:hypothetical protein